MKNLLVLLIIIGILLTSCNKDEDQVNSLETLPPTSIKLEDIGNSGDATDLVASFSKPARTDWILEYRLLVSPASVSLDSLASLQTNDFMVIEPSSSSTKIRLPIELKDSEGDIISEETAYKLYVLAVGESGGLLSEPSNSIQLKPNNIVRTIARFNAGTGGMDIDSEGNIYMADFGRTTGGNPQGTKVFKIEPNGNVSTFATGLRGASGNDFDHEGNLIQSNIFHNSISKISPDGNVTELVNGFSAPVGVVVAPNGDLFVCNCNENTISRVDTDLNVTTFASGSLFSCPNGIDMDEAGNLYVANFNGRSLVKITPEGTTSRLASLPGSNNGHLVIHGSFIYVIGRGLHQIYQVSFSGNVSVFAGIGSRGVRDGALANATFSLPNDLVFSADGSRIYVNDVDGSDSDGTVISPVAIRVIEIVE